MSKTEILAGLDATKEMIEEIRNREQKDELDLAEFVQLVCEYRRLKGMLATAN